MKTLKTVFLASISLVTAGILSAQTNLWQNTGNVGIGTTSPLWQTTIVKSDSGGAGSFYGGTLVLSRYVNTLTNQRSSAIYHYYDGSSTDMLAFGVDGSGTRNPAFIANAQMVLTTAGNVGIGTTNPGDRLHVSDSIRVSPFTHGQNITYLNSGATLKLMNGNIFNPDGAALSKIVFGGMYNPTGNQANEASYNYIEWSSGWLSIRNNQETKLQIGAGLEWGHQDVYLNPTGGNVGIGTTNPTEKLAVNGKIRAREVIVESTGWSDYVFKPDYRLASLSEVEGAINRDGHLPGVPSAQEVAEKGVSVGDMQAVLLAKIEELTLHQIAQEKELSALRAENGVLRSRLDNLERQ
jgi:hypothetical protein